jgi:hypothetical protein
MTKVRPMFGRGARGTMGVVLMAGSLGVIAAQLLPASAGAATIGTVSVSPATGTIDTASAFGTSDACPEAATKFKVTFVGAGVTTLDNVVGTSTIQTPGQALSGVFLSDGTWRDFANREATTLSGTGTMTLICLSGALGNKDEGEFTSTITFTGDNYATGTGATPAPSGTPAATPTPTPTSGGGTPTPTPAPTDSPAPGDATPTPDPDAVNGDETDSGGTGSASGGGGSLPGTGAQDPAPIVMLAAMMGLAGGAVLLFEAATRLEDE